MSVQILPNSIPKSTFRSILNSNFASLSSSLQNNTNVLSNSANFVLHNGNTRTENLLIGTNDNFNLNFETGGIIRMTVLSGGNVGINASTPNERLTVVGNVSATGNIAAQSSTIPISVTSLTTNRTFSNSDTNKVFHLSGSTPLSAIFPSSLSDGFNVALMNTGTSTLHLSTNSPYKAIGNVLTDQYAGAYVYKANSEIFAVGGF